MQTSEKPRMGVGQVSQKVPAFSVSTTGGLVKLSKLWQSDGRRLALLYSGISNSGLAACPHGGNSGESLGRLVDAAAQGSMFGGLAIKNRTLFKFFPRIARPCLKDRTYCNK